MTHQGTTVIQCDKCRREMDTGEVWHSRSYAVARRAGWQTANPTGTWKEGDDLCPECRISIPNDTYCDARRADGTWITGWVFADKTGKPAYFQVEGGGGFCIPLERLADIKPVQP